MSLHSWHSCVSCGKSTRFAHPWTISVLRFSSLRARPHNTSSFSASTSIYWFKYCLSCIRRDWRVQVSVSDSFVIALIQLYILVRYGFKCRFLGGHVHVSESRELILTVDRRHARFWQAMKWILWVQRFKKCYVRERYLQAPFLWNVLIDNIIHSL